MNAGATPAVGAGATADLRLFVRCRDRILTLDTTLIERVLLVEEAAPVGDPTPGGTAPAGWLGILGEGKGYAAWDLGRLLGVGATERAWILLRPFPAPGAVPLALRAGACLKVAPLDAATLDLPGGIFTRRGRALRVAFRDRRGGAVGLDVDLDQLWLPDEIEWSKAALAAPGADHA